MRKLACILLTKGEGRVSKRMMNLSGSEEEEEQTLTLKVNKQFAKHYEKSRRSEELMKCKSICIFVALFYAIVGI